VKCVEGNLSNDKIQIKKALVDILLLFFSKSEKLTEKFGENTTVL